MVESVFEVRRSRAHVLLQAGFGMFLLALAAANLGNLFRQGDAQGGPLFASLLFAGLMAFYVWNLLAQYRDRRPQVIVGPAGLYLPSAHLEPVPWSHVWNVAPPSGVFSRMRLDVDIAPEISARMKLGQRFMGENVVRRKGVGGGLTIYTMGYEHNAAEIAEAIRRYWPPPSSSQDDEEA